MSIRTRIVFALLIIGLTPIIVAAFQAYRAFGRLLSQAEDLSQSALEQAGQDSIRQQAQAVAREIALYLKYHPEVGFSNAEALQANTELAAIAVQPVGNTGYTAVFDSRGITHFHRNPAVVGMDMSTLASKLPDFWAIMSASLAGQPSEGYYDWQEADGTIRRKYMAIAAVPDSPLRVAATIYIDDFTQPVVAIESKLQQTASQTQSSFMGIIAVTAVVAVAAAVVFAIRLTSPIKVITETAVRLMQGKMETIHIPYRQDELGVLSRAINAMTAQLRSSLENLEREVNNRTRQLTRRTAQLKAAAQVARDAAAIRDLKELLGRITELISERFGFYHVGIFLVDEAGEYAILQAANSEGGQRMLARGHKLKVGLTGIVGFVAQRGEPRIALDVGADAVFFNNPDLPQTRSEMALPLKSRQQVIGVLDVQSVEASAFSEDDIETLQLLADQIAMAIENARLFQTSQEALRELSALYGQQTLQAWRKRLGGKSLAFRYNRLSVDALPLSAVPAVEEDAHSLVVPITIRDQPLGVVHLRREAEDAAWTPDDRALVEEAVGQISQALETARLLEEIRRRAQQESLIGQITAKMQGSLDVDAVLKTIVREVGSALDTRRVQIRLGQVTAEPLDQSRAPAQEGER